MKTPMEFALELGHRFQGPVWAEQIAEILVIRDAEIRQACAAEYQPRIDELKEATAAAVMAERKMWQGRESEGYRQHLLQRVTDADAIIDEARNLAERWKITCRSEDFDSEEHPVYMVDSWLDHANELQAVLDRSGARGGSVAENPASSPDNPPTTKDGSRT